mgnify:CR=1 FL=1
MTLVQQLLNLIPADVTEVNIVCVGTDRSTGDSLGPWAGLMLQERGVPNVYGTIFDPVHAVRLQEGFMDTLPKRFTIGVDACLGQSSSVGKIKVLDGPLSPGEGVLRNDLPKVGNISVVGIVNVGGFMEYFVLQNTRLSLVYDMATQVAEALTTVTKRINTRSLEVV